MADVLAPAPVAADAVVVLTNRPASRREWFTDLFRHRDVLAILTRKDFQTRYKRASLGLLWAVVIPLTQAGVMALIFSRVVAHNVGGEAFAAYLMTGMLVWSYFGVSLLSASTAVVDGAALTDKVWFPRAVLVIVPLLSNLVGLFVSLGLFVILLPFLDITIGPRLLLLVPACSLVVGFALGASLVLSALHVYFRDVKFIVQAALMVWLYATPIVYQEEFLGHTLARVVDFNPMSGVVALFRLATVGSSVDWQLQVAVAVVTTMALVVIGLEAHRRHDRLFVDLL